jgi:hypothetical protein
VRDPSSDTSVLVKSRASEILSGRRGDEEGQRTADQLLRGGDLPLEALGSGSDFTPFLQHAGIASLNLGLVMTIRAVFITRSTIRMIITSVSMIPIFDMA